MIYPDTSGSFYDFRAPVVAKVEPFVALLGTMLLGSALDQPRVGAAPGKHAFEDLRNAGRQSIGRDASPGMAR